MFLNRHLCMGHLGAKPEIRYTSLEARPYCKFAVATTKRWRDKNGQKQESTEWIHYVAWGKTAENASQWLDKGKGVYCEGELRTRTYEKDGEKRYFTYVLLRDFQILTPKKDSAEEELEVAHAAEGSCEPEDDDIPF